MTDAGMLMLCLSLTHPEKDDAAAMAMIATGSKGRKHPFTLKDDRDDGIVTVSGYRRCNGIDMIYEANRVLQAERELLFDLHEVPL